MTRRKLTLLFIILVSATASAGTDKKALALGDPSADLLYTPLSLCRIIDTRLGGGTLGSTARDFYVAGNTHDFASQGGKVGGCGVPVGSTAVVINFVAVSPAGAGNLRGSAWPLAVPSTGSFINYQRLTPNLNVANGIPFAICDPASATCDFDIRLLANGAATHLVADVAGYFSRFPKLNLIAGDGLSVNATSGDVTLSMDFTPSGTDTTAARSDHKHSVQVVIVTPVGDETENGSALLAALGAITDASANKPYLLKIDAGIYDLGFSTLNAKQHVHLEGSGESRTIIRRRPGNNPLDAVIVGASNSDIRSLTAETSGAGGAIGTGIYLNATTNAISNVTARATNGSFANTGVQTFGATVALNSVSAFASGGSEAQALYLIGSSVVRVTDGTAQGSAAPTAIGVRNNGNLEVSLVNVRATGTGSTFAVGVFNVSASATLLRVRAEASGSSQNFAVFNVGGGSQTVRIDQSELIASTATIRNDNGATFVGASRLAGGNILVVGGSVACMESYNENYTNPGGFGACP